MQKSLFLLIFTLFFISSCCKESHESARYMLTDEEKDFIPYEQGDSVKFIHSGGNEFGFEVVNEYTYLDRTYAEHCGENYVAYEYKIAELFSVAPYLNLIFKVTPVQFHPFLEIQLNNYYFHIDISKTPQMDSVKLGENIFYDVYKVESNMYDNPEIQPNRVLYNKQFGVLQINFTNNDSITLKK